MRTGSRLLVVTVVLALLAPACSSSRRVTDAQEELIEEASEDDKKKSNKSGKGKGKKGKGNKKGSGQDGAAAADGPGGSSNEPSGTASNAPGLQPLGPGGPEYARQSARHEEPQPDGKKEGVTPNYAEMIALDIQGLGKDVRFTFEFAGNVPQKLATPDTYMVVGLGISGVRKGDQGYALGAQGSNEGWKAYAGSKSETQGFPGTFFVRENRIEMTIPWSFIEGPRPFEWYGSSSWFQNIGGTTSYVFDVIPNDGSGRFPSN